MKVGIIKLPPLSCNVNKIWVNKPDYVIEVWSSGVKVDLQKLGIENDSQWNNFKMVIKLSILVSIKAQISKLGNDISLLEKELVTEVKNESSLW